MVGLDVSPSQVPCCNPTLEQTSSTEGVPRGAACGCNIGHLPTTATMTNRGRASDETGRLKTLLNALRRLEAGDLSVRLEAPSSSPADDMTDEEEQLHNTIAHVFNRVVASNAQMCSELDRVHHAIAVEGDFDQRVHLPQAQGSWLQALDTTNKLIDSMAHPMALVRGTIGAVAEGDLSAALALLQTQPSVRTPPR